MVHLLVGTATVLAALVEVQQCQDPTGNRSFAGASTTALLIMLLRAIMAVHLLVGTATVSAAFLEVQQCQDPTGNRSIAGIVMTDC